MRYLLNALLLVVLLPVFSFGETNDYCLTLKNNTQQIKRLLSSNPSAIEKILIQSDELKLHCSNSSIKKEFYLTEALYYSSVDSVDESMNAYSLAIQQCQSKTVEQADLFFQYGLFLKSKHKLKLALFNFTNALELYKDNNLELNVTECLIQLGELYIISGEWTLAMNAYVESLNISEKIKNNKLIAKSWHQIGVVHWKEGNNKYATKALNKGLAQYLKIGDSLGIADSYNYLGVINKIEKRYHVALNYYKKSLDIRIKYNDKPGISQSYFNIGSVYQNLNQFDLALHYYNLSYEIKNLLKDEYSYLAYYLNTSEIYAKTKNFEQAQVNLNKGLAIAKKIGASDYSKSFLRNLSELYNATGRFKAAFDYRIEYEKIKDTLLNREKNSAFIALQTKYDLNEKERNIERLENEKKLSDEKTARENTLRNSLMFIIVLALLVILLVFNRVRYLKSTNIKLNSQKSEIEKREKEKEILLREVHHRVKNNLQLTSSLINLQARQIHNNDAVMALREARDRIKAISLIHEKLYSRNQFEKVNLKNYIPEICNTLLYSYANIEKKIDFVYDLCDAEISIDEAISIGLIVNETVTNSFKHAFNQVTSGKIWVSILLHENNLSLIVADNGSGIENVSSVKENFGLKLIRSLVVKLKGTFNLKNQNGTVVEIQMNKNSIK